MKKIIIPVITIFMAYGLNAQWSNRGGKATTSSSVEIDLNDSGHALRIEGDNKDLDFSIGHAPGGYGYFWRYKGSGSGNNNDMEFWSENQTSSDKLIYRVKQDGNISFEQKVAIGTDKTGSHLLAVDGSIGAREVVVEGSGWSDFVFEEGYHLPSLSEVENHILTKGHLKDIPSAGDIEKDGITLGQMDAKLLQKIEELTLYVLELDKENKERQVEIEQLQKSNNALLELLKNKSK